MYADFLERTYVYTVKIIHKNRGAKLVLSTFILACVLSCTYYPDRNRYNQDYYYDTYYYHYYPTSRVYFHIYSGEYYHYHDRKWVKVRRLPPYIRLDPRDRVRIRIQSQQPPYHKNKEHRERFRPHKEYRSDPEHDHKERIYNREQYERSRKPRRK
jgi:hypothetical protein